MGTLILNGLIQVLPSIKTEISTVLLRMVILVVMEMLYMEVTTQIIFSLQKTYRLQALLAKEMELMLMIIEHGHTVQQIMVMQ